MSRNFDASLGAMLGAALGDSLGCPLEFDHDITSEKVEHALTLPGGGHWKVGRAQGSDDSELLISLAMSLCDAPNNRKYEQKLFTTARNYITWIRSCPFDCGGTTARAFSIDPKASDLVARMMANSARCNAVSQANGQAMRTTPLAVYGHKLCEDDLAMIARNDALLSHPNKTTQDCGAAYCIAIAHLINFPQDGKGAIAKATSWASRNACQDVKDWLADAREDCSQMDCSWRNIGWVKWGFTLAFYHLRLETAYTQAMRHTLSLKGDCDTNACIVGGLLGAYWGVSRLPKEMVKKLLTYTYEKHGGRQRPDWLSARYIPKLAKHLHEISPDQLEK